MHKGDIGGNVSVNDDCFEAIHKMVEKKKTKEQAEMVTEKLEPSYHLFTRCLLHVVWRIAGSIQGP